jgi:leader peptidase (prepilin peptidase)/N-methyltransferase
MIGIIPAEWGGCRLGAASGTDRPGRVGKPVFAAQLDRFLRLGEQGWALLLLAPFVGSFLGVLIRRLPEGRPIVRGRSHCEWCSTRLTPGDLVPLLSWLVTHGRCRHCRHPLGWFYPGVELAALAIAAIALAVDGVEQAWLDCLLGWWLLVLGWIDVRYWLLPDVLTLPLLVLGLALTTALALEGLADHAAAAIIGYLALRAVAWIYQRLRHREGLGQGDAKLFAAAGAWLGIAALPQVILLAALAALITAAGLALAGRRMRAHSALPFGPFLALATWLLWLSGPLSL